ncbi:MAG: NAD-dependent epimerase/dehydratase family protein [Candidatus Jettenia sp.]|nr:NAD-dependent epimerase/dehydratase family protein [Candidatus Jettenia sp.]
MRDLQEFNNANILITGGLGFIGSSLARRLVQLHAKVTVVDSLIPLYGGNLFNVHDIKDRININISDVRDPYAMAYLIKGKDFLFNLAGQTSHVDSMTNPQTDLDINASAQLSILESCRKHNPDVRIVFASTRQLYGKPEYLPVDEQHPICPVDVNGINKLAGEWYHLLYNNVYRIRSCALRLTNTYGPGMRVKDARQTFLGIWLRNLIEGVPIKVFGDGLQLRDFNYVSDVVDAILIAAVNPKAYGEVFNLGSTQYISLKDLAVLLIELFQGGTYRIVPFPSELKAIDIGNYYSDYTKINQSLGWSPRVSLRDGLKQTIEYYIQNRTHYWE